jgi:hypothetical protein
VILDVMGSNPISRPKLSTVEQFPSLHQPSL